MTVELLDRVRVSADLQFDQWCNANFDTSYNLPVKGRLFGALVILWKLESNKWDYSELSAIHSADVGKYFGNRSISGHTSARVASILESHGHADLVPMASKGEMGRTSTGTKQAGLDFIRLIAQALALLPDKTEVDAQGDALTAHLYDRIFSLLLEYQMLGGIDMPFSASESISAHISKLLDAHQSKSGAVLQHLVGAKLEIRFADQHVTIVHNRSATADVQTGRLGDFEIGSTVFHVTKSATVDHCRKAWSNAQSGRKVYLLVPSKTLIGVSQFAESIQPGFTKKVDVFSIEQFVAQNLDELAVFDHDEALRQLRRLLAKYNELVTRYENDPSLKIVIPDFGVA